MLASYSDFKPVLLDRATRYNGGIVPVRRIAYTWIQFTVQLNFPAVQYHRLTRHSNLMQGVIAVTACLDHPKNGKVIPKHEQRIATITATLHVDGIVEKVEQ